MSPGKKEINKVYDPACASGSLLLKAEKVLGKDAIRNGFYGKERLVVGVLDNIKNRADFAEARDRLGWNEEEV